MILPRHSAAEDDIIDETLYFFKPNVLFKHFEVKGGADRVLIYLTLYITQCLQKLEKCPNQMEGLKSLTAMAHEQFKIPGDAGFALGSFFPSPGNSQEAGEQRLRRSLGGVGSSRSGGGVGLRPRAGGACGARDPCESWLRARRS